MLSEKRAGIRCRAGLARHDPADARLIEIETLFLEERIRSLRHVLDAHLRQADDVDGGAGGTVSTRRDVWMARRREVQILEDLLHAPERQHRHLECVLGDRLRCAEQEASQRSALALFKRGCDEACWTGKMEHQVLAKILGDWWRWLRRSVTET